MNEKDFDISVRNLLQNAEEPVSPRVWKGVAAGLDRQHRVIPFWLWGAMTAAVAAAVIAGVVILWPAATIEPSNQSISLAQAELPAAPANPAEASDAVPAQGPETEQAARATQPHRKMRTAPAAPESTPEAIPSSKPLLAALEVSRPQLVPIRASIPVSQVSDQELLETLARSEQKASDGRGLSIMAVGNLQGNSRQDVPIRNGHGFAKAGALPNREFIEETSQDNFGLPFSAGINLKYNFTPRWAVGLGVRYTNLSRTFLGIYHSGEGYDVGDYDSPTSIDNQQHWMGIPLNVYYDIVNRGRWRVHAFTGGSFEFLLDNDFLVHAPNDFHYHQTGRHSMWSVGAGLGVEFKITPHIGLFLDPGIRYYLFNAAEMPRSLRTIQPLRFDIEGGLRFSLGKN